MARSHKRSSGARRSAKPRAKPKAKPKTKPVFRARVEAELVDQLLRRFVALVKHGLELMLATPSEHAREVLRHHPELAYGPADIPVLVTWVAQGAYEQPWPNFCQHVWAQTAWQTLLGVQTPADLEALAARFAQAQVRLIELAVHEALKEGDKQDTRPARQHAPVCTEFAEFIGVSQVIKRLKKRLRPFLKRLDAQDPAHPAHRPRAYRSRSFLLADLLRWLLGLASTDELIRKLKQHPCLAGAANFRPGHIPSKATFSRRRMLIPLADLRAILHELGRVLTRLKVIDGQVWVLDLTRLPTHSSVSKEYPDRPNGKSDGEAAFCGYPDNDGGLQFGYALLFVVDFKTELPLAVLFTGGQAQDGPLAPALLGQAEAAHPALAERCWLVVGDGGYDAVPIFEHILHRLRALPVITKNPRHAADPQADLATDAYCVLRRPSPWHQALFRSQSASERQHSRLKLLFNLKYHKNRGWDAVEHCALFAAIAMLGLAWVAITTGHPDKIRAARTWISLS